MEDASFRTVSKPHVVKRHVAGRHVQRRGIVEIAHGAWRGDGFHAVHDRADVSKMLVMFMQSIRPWRRPAMPAAAPLRRHRRRLGRAPRV